jgi:hypothetical protein
MRSGTESRIYQNVVRAAALNDTLPLGLAVDATRPARTTYRFDLAAIEAGIRAAGDPVFWAKLWGESVQETAPIANDLVAQHPDPRDWRMDRSHLKVVAFVQDLETSDVLQAAVATVPSTRGCAPQ